MFYNSQNNTQKKVYQEYLQTVGGLSNLFSDSTTPYLYYRIAEKMFCKAFGAKDLSRGDISYDAKKDKLGIALKTFLRNNNKTMQKIAEFNKNINEYKDLKDIDKIIKISKLRNTRLDFTNNLYNIDSSIFHCVVRDTNRFYIYEEENKKIDISSIKNIKRTNSSIFFDDGIYEYSFSLSKSTLLKRFNTNNFIDSFDINILKNPLDELKSINKNKEFINKSNIIDTVYLPLYGKNKIVYKNSGLNQWNAKGRKRDINEIYIPIPRKFYDFKDDFFPNKDIIFTLNLPNGKSIVAKICQENKKALMSNPNKDLGLWLLRDVFRLKHGELLTNKHLEMYGVDSIRIDKLDNLNYDINFSKIDSFENFIEDLQNKKG